MLLWKIWFLVIAIARFFKIYFLNKMKNTVLHYMALSYLVYMHDKVHGGVTWPTVKTSWCGDNCLSGKRAEARGSRLKRRLRWILENRKWRTPRTWPECPQLFSAKVAHVINVKKIIPLKWNWTKSKKQRQNGIEYLARLPFYWTRKSFMIIKKICD